MSIKRLNRRKNVRYRKKLSAELHVDSLIVALQSEYNQVSTFKSELCYTLGTLNRELKKLENFTNQISSKETEPPTIDLSPF